MAIHKSRTGALLVCWPCQQGRCDECMSVVLDDGAVVCHDPECRPTCTEVACQPENLKGAGVKQAQEWARRAAQ